MATSKPIDATMALTPFAHGAAGHEGISSNASGSLIIKPCTQAEISFYESAKAHPDFQAHMPTFMGSLTLNNDPAVQDLMSQADTNTNTNANTDAPPSQPPNATTEENTSTQNTDKPKDWVPSGGKKLATGLAIVLENAAAGFTRPNVLDLKLGARLWDDDAPEAKRRKLDQVAAETTSGSLGFRVAGMKVWLDGTTDAGNVEVNTEVKDGYKSYNKVYGRTLTDDNVSNAFVRFVGGRETTGAGEDKTAFQRRRAGMLLKRLLREVESVEYVLERQESRMYSASILVVLEGDDVALEKALDEEVKAKPEADEDETDDVEDKEEDDGDEEIGPKVLEVRLIDFAHASWTTGQGPDENALRGVRSVRKIVEELVRTIE